MALRVQAFDFPTFSWISNCKSSCVCLQAICRFVASLASKRVHTFLKSGRPTVSNCYWCHCVKHLDAMLYYPVRPCSKLSVNVMLPNRPGLVAFGNRRYVVVTRWIVAWLASFCRARWKCAHSRHTTCRGQPGLIILECTPQCLWCNGCFWDPVEYSARTSVTASDWARAWMRDFYHIRNRIVNWAFPDQKSFYMSVMTFLWKSCRHSALCLCYLHRSASLLYSLLVLNFFWWCCCGSALFMAVFDAS